MLKSFQLFHQFKMYDFRKYSISYTKFTVNILRLSSSVQIHKIMCLDLLLFVATAFCVLDIHITIIFHLSQSKNSSALYGWSNMLHMIMQIIQMFLGNRPRLVKSIWQFLDCLTEVCFEFHLWHLRTSNTFCLTLQFFLVTTIALLHYKT